MATPLLLGWAIAAAQRKVQCERSDTSIENGSRAIAFLSSGHPRLGASSTARCLPPELARRICILSEQFGPGRLSADDLTVDCSFFARSDLFDGVYEGQYYRRDVAVKRSTKLSLGQGLKRRVDLRVMRSQGHPNVLFYYGAIQTSEHIDIVFEFVRCRLEQLPLSRQPGYLRKAEPAISQICKQVLSGLDYLHTRTKPIHHGSLRASLIGLSYGGDFKLSLGHEHFCFCLGVPTSRGCHYRSLPYSLTYTPPEGPNQGAPGDIWSIGAIAYERASGKRFDAGHSRPLSTPDYSELLADFVSVCLQSDPAKRPTARELLVHPFMARGTPAAVVEWLQSLQ